MRWICRDWWQRGAVGRREGRHADLAEGTLLLSPWPLCPLQLVREDSFAETLVQLLLSCLLFEQCSQLDRPLR